jgi:hypothetical protein
MTMKPVRTRERVLWMVVAALVGFLPAVTLQARAQEAKGPAR